MLDNAKPKASVKVDITKKSMTGATPSKKASPVINLTKGSELKSNINYKAGDRVSHIKFGEGVVTEIDTSGNNTYVKIDFDQYGQRILDSRFAKLNVL